MNCIRICSVYKNRYNYNKLRNSKLVKNITNIHKHDLLKKSLYCLALTGILSLTGCTKEEIEPFTNDKYKENEHMNQNTDKNRDIGVTVIDSVKTYQFDVNIAM